MHHGIPCVAELEEGASTHLGHSDRHMVPQLDLKRAADRNTFGTASTPPLANLVEPCPASSPP